ncbi:MAG: peroxiredoxin [Woeseia sp.]
MLQTGTKAPEFVLPDEQGVDTALSDLLRNGPLILYFYPADFTPFCTREACSIRDLHEDIAAAGIRIVGISPQDAASHLRFRKQYRLPFTLLSDPEKRVVRMYDVDGPFGVRVRRATYLIGEDRNIEAALLADFKVSRHEDFIRKAIELRGTSNGRR